MKNRKAFTLIELLIAISIIGVLISISIFSTSEARKTSRDGRRKADLELIRSGLELYKADCNSYPTAVITKLTQLKGDGVGNCLASNIYINSIPKDPLDPSRSYTYSSADAGITYSLCASLESLAGTCNYVVTNP